ncbi:MAG: cobalamin-dependent protein [Balneolaceae bacterium]
MVKQAGTDRILLARKHELARLITEMHFRTHSGHKKNYDIEGRIKYHEDTLHHLGHLAQSIRSGDPGMFSDYVEWSNSMLHSRKIPATELADNLEFMSRSSSQLLDKDQAKEVDDYLKKGLAVLENKVAHPATGLSEENPLLPYAKTYLSLLLEGEKERAYTLIKEVLDHGASIEDVYEYIFEATLHEIGRLWQINVITIAHEHYFSAATQLIMTRLFTYIFNAEKKTRKLVSCTISGDLHEIGIRMVSDFFEMNGWDTYYMGANMPANELVHSLYEQDADILAISVTIPSYLNKAEDLISRIRGEKNLDFLKILVGGYTFGRIPDLWEKIGADASAANARHAVSVAKSMMS